MTHVVGKEPETGPTAQTVAENIQRLREAQGLNYTQLSERLLSVASWSINAVGVRRIESGERRVTPDDLMAMAVALGVSPVTLLMPDSPNAEDRVAVTGLPTADTARVVWEWFTASQWGYWALQDISPVRPSVFFGKAWPHWLQQWSKANIELIDQGWDEARERTRQQLLGNGPGVDYGDD